ncbi:sensor histidine kinase [Glycomyces buryatensis]|uniref:histidine kinase n=1 Tax=Glycomyces buryatensis TaxID=2570927 RepID=A0A4S8PX51_9ACTN|nr:sensor histidine kinase [Glycomyces buryatensis]THV34645.1 sensor histidine kinase [Glycomyces buryatensis]
MTTTAHRQRIKAIAFDVGLAVFLGLMTSGMTIGADPDHSPPYAAFGLVWVAALALAVRRRWPEVTLAVSMAALATYLLLDYPEGPVYLLPAVAVFFFAFARPIKLVIPVLVGLFLLNVPFHTYALGEIDDVWINATITLVWLAVPAACGRLVYEARRARTREREAERERHRADERVAMAREIHDVVGHSLAVVSMNAGVALHVLEKRPDAPAGVVENLRAIRDTSSRALDDLRSTLAPLRGGSRAELRPTFVLADLSDLIEDVRKGGLRVESEITGDIEALPAGVSGAAYRVVQEALTNVIRHARATSASVVIASGAGTLVIDVKDDGRGGELDPERAGQGITGMMERVQSHGGAFEAGPAPDGGFAVHAELPYGRTGA